MLSSTSNPSLVISEPFRHLPNILHFREPTRRHSFPAHNMLSVYDIIGITCLVTAVTVSAFIISILCIFGIERIIQWEENFKSWCRTVSDRIYRLVHPPRRPSRPPRPSTVQSFIQPLPAARHRDSVQSIELRVIPFSTSLPPTQPSVTSFDTFGHPHDRVKIQHEDDGIRYIAWHHSQLPRGIHVEDDSAT